MVSSVPPAARQLVRTITRAVNTAASGHQAAYDTAITQLATHPIAGRVVGDLLRLLLEDLHPDGLDSADIALAVGRCYRTATAWQPPERVDAATLLAVLASALGIHEPGTHEPGTTYQPPDPPVDERRDPHDAIPATTPAWPDYAWHAPLLVADLLPFAPATLDSYLEAAFGEYAREAREEPP
jgi:hypothetical protein